MTVSSYSSSYTRGADNADLLIEAVCEQRHDTLLYNDWNVATYMLQVLT